MLYCLISFCKIKGIKMGSLSSGINLLIDIHKLSNPDKLVFAL